MRAHLLALVVAGLVSACSTEPAPATPDAANQDVAPSRDTLTLDAVSPDLGDTTARDAVSDAPSAATDAPDTATVGSLASLVSRTTFEQLFPHRGTAPCRGAFYTYEAFLRAARDFPNFSGEGTEEVRRRELAAFLANIAHETTGGWPTAPDGQFSWGLCWVEEGGATPQTAAYCAPSTEFPCAAAQRYYGRGPIQLSWNYNYGQAGRALSLPLLTDPGLVARDPVVAFRTAFWFWMTPQAPKPSCHDVMVGAYTPSAEDRAAGRLPGFGLTVNIINGGLECGRSTPPSVQDRLGYYHRFTDLLGVSPGPGVDCASMRPFG